MKTAQNCYDEIQELILSNDPKKYNETEYKRAGKRATFLRNVAAYLESTTVNESSLKRDLALLEKREAQLRDGYQDWFDSLPPFDMPKNPLMEYNKISGLNKVKLQIKTIKYILSDI